MIHFPDRIMTYDEKWILYINRKRLIQWFNHKEARKDFTKPELHQQSYRSPALTLSISAFWNITRASLPKFSVSNRMKCIFNKTNRHQLIDEAQFCFMSMHNQMMLTDMGYNTLPQSTHSLDLSPLTFQASVCQKTFLCRKCI